MTATIASEFAGGNSPNYIRSQLKAAEAGSVWEFEDIRKQLALAEANLATARAHASYLKKVGSDQDDPNDIIQQAEQGASRLIPCVDEVDRLKKLHTEKMLERDKRSTAVARVGGHSPLLDLVPRMWAASVPGLSSNNAARPSHVVTSLVEPSLSRRPSLVQIAEPSDQLEWQERVDGSQDICRRCNGVRIGCRWLQDILDSNSLDEELLWFEASQMSAVRTRDLHTVNITLHVRPRAPVVLRALHAVQEHHRAHRLRAAPAESDDFPSPIGGRSNEDISTALDDRVASRCAEPRLVTKATTRRWDIKRIVPRDQSDLDSLSLFEVLHVVRTLVSNFNEAMFYMHVAQMLGPVPIVRSLAVDFECQLERTLAAAAAATEPEIARKGLAECGFVFILEHVDTRSYVQKSPLSVQEARVALSTLAKIHAAAWTGAPAMGTVQQWLHSEAGWWTLSRSGTDDSVRIKESMLRVTAALGIEFPELFGASVRALADRLVKRIEWIDAAIHGIAARKFFTLVHGNCGASTNLYIRKDFAGDGLDVLVKGFEWAGLGLGMRDVAYLLSYSGPLHIMSQLEPMSFTGVRSEHASVSENELALVKHYHEQVVTQLCTQGQLSSAEAYTIDVALAHYKLCMLDFGRVILSNFYKDFSTQMLCANSKDASLPIACRTRDCAVRLIQRLDSILAEFEDRFGLSETWPL
jgi:hypothetical protein